MKISIQQKWTMISMLGMIHWFFGNLYEAIVFSPNWIIDSPAQIKRLNEFFITTSPVIYFVPLTQLATLIVWFLYWKNQKNTIHNDLRLASLFALLATAINVVVVSTAATKLFDPDYAKYGDYLTTLTWRWNILNIFRMGSVSTTIYFLFQSYIKLDRLKTYQYVNVKKN